MKKVLMLLILLISSAFPAFAEDPVKDENRSFYTGNVYYEKKDYAKAMQNYRAALEMGIESGNLYYNMGNAYLRMGKIGYAMLFYEKAMRLIPQDGDLKSNMVYAKAFLPGASAPGPSGFSFIASLIKSPFGDLNLNAVAIMAILFYLLSVCMAILFLITPFFAKKLKILFALTVFAFLWSGVVFGVRYYEEEVLKKGVVVIKTADAKYEPVESSTTYYKIQEGDEVTILGTREGWRHIRRQDGKSAWVGEAAVEEV
jgi:tetratricopeptide (TPR) repeat protein